MIFFRNKKKFDYFTEEKNIIKRIKTYKDHSRIPEIDPEKNFEKIMEELKDRSKINPLRYKYKIAAFTFVFICVIGLFFLLNGKVKKADKYKIDELRTEFVISGTDIKILWVQKKDFNLNKLKSDDN